MSDTGKSSAAYAASASLHVSLAELNEHALAAADSDQQRMGMAQAFSQAHLAFQALDKSPLPDQIAQQQRVRDTLVKLLTLHHRVQQISIFSSNEEIDDVSTGDLKYALVPYFLGEVCLKINDDSRAAHLRASSRYFLSFLRQCASFRILSPKDQHAMEQIDIKYVRSLPRQGNEPLPELAPRLDPGAERTEKLERLRRKKEAEKQLDAAMNSLNIRIKRMGAEAADEQADDNDNERIYLRAYLEYAILASIDNCHMSSRELEVLSMRPAYENIVRAEQRDGMPLPVAEKPKVMRIEPRANGPAVVSANFAVDSSGNMVRRSGGARGDGAVKVSGMKLVPLSTAIDIRTQYASRVFRDFNPPTMDEAEYMKVLEARGFFANAQGGGNADAEPEEVDEDDEDAVDADTLKKRNWDNWKDENPKGAGNRLNK
jgi:hypothetical protein